MREELERACRYALRLLDYRERSKQEIRDRMKKKGYGDDLIEEVLRYLEAHNFVNERRFAQIWGEHCIRKGYGRRRTYIELREKGLETDLIDEVLNELYSEVDETGMALSLIKRRRFLLRGSRESRIRRTYEFLRRRGFSPEVIHEVMREIESVEGLTDSGNML